MLLIKLAPIFKDMSIRWWFSFNLTFQKLRTLDIYQVLQISSEIICNTVKKGKCWPKYQIFVNREIPNFYNNLEFWHAWQPLGWKYIAVHFVSWIFNNSFIQLCSRITLHTNPLLDNYINIQGGNSSLETTIILWEQWWYISAYLLPHLKRSPKYFRLALFPNFLIAPN